jgi:RNA polymerase sigma factor (sigma-70 family)
MARDLTSASTEELLRRIAKPADDDGLGRAVSELITRYKSVVYNHILRICHGNRALADEAFQETFIRLFTWLRDQEDREPLHTFAKLASTFASRTAIDLMRREIRQTPTGSEDEGLAVPAPAVEGTDWETRAYVVKLLEQLDERSREVLRLTYFDDLSATEIGVRLGLAPGHVRILRFRALEALRALKQRDELADWLEPL